MVKQPTISRRNGVRDFLLLRLSALVLAAYVLFLFAYLLCSPQLDYTSWRALFAALPMQLFTLLALAALLLHGWIGLWQVITDYIKPAALRAAALALVSVTVISYLAFGLLVLRGL